MKTRYFKREQEKNLYNYYRVVGGEGLRSEGYQEVICFLNNKPIIAVEHNNMTSLTGTWCTHEVGEPITKEEYDLQYKKATNLDFEIIS